MSERRRTVDAVRMLDELEAMAGGLDLGRASRAIEAMVDALVKQAEALAAREYDPFESRNWREQVLEVLRGYAKTGDEVAKRLVREKPAVADFAEISKSLNQVAAAADQVYRLAEFAQGREDSRPGGKQDWLSQLSDEQVKQVQAWVSEGKGRR